MTLGAKYKHKYEKGLTCIVETLTNKGCKVKQKYFEGKEKTVYYFTIDFENSNRGFWAKF